VQWWDAAQARKNTVAGGFAFVELSSETDVKTE